MRNLLFKEVDGRKMVSDFLHELETQFDRYVHLKERLDTKANNMIMMAGTIAVLFMGFGAFLLSDVKFTLNYGFPIIASGALIVELILTMITIKCALDSYRLREYIHPISFRVFYAGDELDPDVVEQFQNASDQEIEEHFINQYLTSMRSYQIQNTEQTGGINTAQRAFVGAVVMIPIFTVFILLTKFISV